MIVTTFKHKIIFIILVFVLGMFFYHVNRQNFKNLKLAVTSRFNNSDHELSREIKTHLIVLNVKTIKLDEFNGRGGGISEVDGKIFYVTPYGKLGIVDPENLTEIEFSVPPVPMNRNELLKAVFIGNKDFNMEFFRVAGIYAEKKLDKIKVFVTHHFYTENCFQMKVSYLDIQTGFLPDTFTASEWQELVTFQPCIKPKNERWVFGGYAAGGRIVRFDKDFLLVSVGDHEIDGKSQEAFAQDMQKGYGKIWKINKINGQGEIFVSGVRNSQGLFIDHSGKIWETEHGPRGGDELNLIKKGSDYGWPQQTYGIYYGNEPWHPNKIQGSHKLFTQPVYAWLPSIGVSNLTQNNAGRFSLWSDDLIVSTLQEESLYRLRMGENRVIYQEKIKIGSRIRDILTLPDGRLALFTTRADSAVLIIDQTRNIFDKANIAETEQVAYPVKVKTVPEGLQHQFAMGREQFKLRCSACHQVNGVTMQAPSLNGLFARKIASVSNFTYSYTLQSMSDTQWNRKLFRELLLRTNNFKGAGMSKISISDEQLKNLIIYLEYI